MIRLGFLHFFCCWKRICYILAGCGVNKVSHSWSTALRFAAQHSDLECCRLLLQAGAEIDAQEVRRFTLLMMAALNGHLDVADVLLENNCNVNMEASNKRTALHLASERWQINCCCRLLHADCQIDARDSLDCTSIHVAALKVHKELVIYFIQNGADLNKKPNNSNTLLHYAASCGSVQCCKELIRGTLQKTASFRDVNPRNPRQFTLQPDSKVKIDVFLFLLVMAQISGVKPSRFWSLMPKSLIWQSLLWTMGQIVILETTEELFLCGSRWTAIKLKWFSYL